MAVKTFAAIDVGSFEVAMKIYEFSGKNTMREIEHVRFLLDLGTESYFEGKISKDKSEELCRVLTQFSTIMKTYKVQDYKAYGTSAIREIAAAPLILERVKLRTGIHLAILSNSEQRFLHYKAVASKGEVFHKIIENQTAIVDIGGGSLQISRFDQGVLTSTQNIQAGVLRLQERLNRMNIKQSLLEEFVDEMVSTSLTTYQKLYGKEQGIENIILIDDYLSILAMRRSLKDPAKAFVTADAFEEFLGTLRGANISEIAQNLDITEQQVPLLLISAILMKRLITLFGAHTLWIPGAGLCDGIAYDYAERKKLVSGIHDFQKDILACVENISKRYLGNKKQAALTQALALALFDTTAKWHGLPKREKLLLEIAALLIDCGKFISLTAEGTVAYDIIMASEIIGISHAERKVVALVVRHVTVPFEECPITNEAEYVTVTKLTALLRVASALYCSRKPKFDKIKTKMEKGVLQLVVETQEELFLEQEAFTQQANFFREVYGIDVVLKHKKKI
jgi:exopolyphosphatase/guanosine-5'-triphosphate,3'-diphosphate pyrophosphatase